MTLIKSISGIRGTIGGGVGDNLTPLDLVKFITAYSQWLRDSGAPGRKKVVLGRDARISGEMVSAVVTGTLLGCGIDVIDLGLATTPTTELAVTAYGANGGVILTASHNPKQWNALKLLNGRGEFIDDTIGKQILVNAEKEAFDYAEVDELGRVIARESFDEQHIASVLALRLVDRNAVARRALKVVVDGVNSVGGVVIPRLLKELGVEVIELNCDPTGRFAHNPEPLEENLTEICALVKKCGADMGIVVDPDVDRLAFISEDGVMFGEEYTLVAVADYVLSQTKGATVSNLSSSRALRDVAAKYGCAYAAAAVGEVNVVETMKQTAAVIGGEGNGGVIYPESHYGRDALVGVGLFLTAFVKSGLKMSEYRKTFPQYVISKNKIALDATVDTDKLFQEIVKRYQKEEVNTVDGVKIDFPDGWVHLRKSNTEPIVRIYSESATRERADELAGKIIAAVGEMIG